MRPLPMLRILSDLHFRDSSSRLRQLDDLAPLLEGVDELWLNGDTCDNQTGLDPAAVTAMREFFLRHVPRVSFITGNHDPDLSDVHWRHTADRRLWAVHGDVFFDDIVPWSRIRPVLLARIADARRQRPELDVETLAGRSALFRSVCTGLSRECDPERSDLPYRLRRLFTEFFPPRQPWAMVQAWRTLPDRVAHRHRDWFPGARVVVTGHIHFPRTWPRSDVVVINAGSFSRPLGARCVDVVENEVRVRQIAADRAGRWHAPRVLDVIALAP